MPRLPSPGLLQTLRARLLFWILAVAVPIYAASIWLSYHTAAQGLEADATRRADELAARLATGLDGLIRPIEGGIYTVAHQLEEIDPPQSQYLKRIRGILNAWPEVYGSTIAAEVAGRQRPFAPYLYRSKGGIAYSDLALDSYAYSRLPWYRVAADTKKPVWSAPYFDAGGGQVWMITYSVPYFRRIAGERVLAGVVTADLDLDWVRRTVSQVPLGPVGTGWLSAGTGEEAFVAPIGETPQRLVRINPQLDDVDLRRAAAAMQEAGQSFAIIPRGVDGKPAFLAVRGLQTLGWQFMLLTPRADLLAGARQQLNRQLLLGATGLAVLVLAISLVATGVSRPIHALADAVGKAGDGDLQLRLPERSSGDEIGVLTEALRRMRDSLQRHVQLRAESLAAQTRLEQELQISAQIQQSMLPHGDAARALPPGVEVAAALLPARQVGGDLYDYFPVPGGSLLFAIGDVSDKGIPAALFMARLSALMRVLGAGGGSPDRLLAEINARLVEGNDACMFVTAGCGLLDTASGTVRYASAGHEPPLLRLLEGSIRTPAADGGAAIGIDAADTYFVQEVLLAPGDLLLLYTDGVTDAEDAAGATFGLERLVTLLRDSPDIHPTALVARIVDTLASHAAGFHATDDLTVLALRYMPADVEVQFRHGVPAWKIAVGAATDGMQKAQLRLRSILVARGIVGERLHDVELIAEEWLTNVVRAAGGRPLPHLSVELALPEQGIVLTFCDDGAAFDPLAVAAPELDLSLDERQVGGLGIHLIRQTARHCEYEHADGRNLLRVHLDRAD
ncbi:MAG TPA: SpoIIE family protein phosphatase [Steroidobacteraceae bacterium]|nr:SpoIIE family protein phosphatase [Steroidobacteraceae bacterium]